MSNIISCDVHDHFEIACMRRSLVEIELPNEKKVTGQALDIINSDGKEYLSLDIDDNKDQFNLKDISTLTFLDSGDVVKIL